MIFRGIGVLIAFYKSNYDGWEKFFVSIAWSPKATVQAALVTAILDNATIVENETYINWGKQVVTLLATIILISAPTIAIVTTVIGPKMLILVDEVKVK